MEFYFGEHLRLDWGLGDPNKTATLIACLMVLAHAVRHLTGGKKWGLLLFSGLFFGLGICLIHTYSRGGILAALTGQLIYVAAQSRLRIAALSRKDWIVGAGLAVGLIIYSSLPSINAASRYGQGLMPRTEEDRSISNRLRIWKDVPQMMTDAPGGWGRGKSGEAWTKWYQPMETRYEYRTLVNSHFTWLVEFGWVGRFLYIAGWLEVIAMPFVFRFRCKSKSCVAAITAGVWSAFGVGAFFSSVAESWLLWVVPMSCLLWLVAGHSAGIKKWGIQIVGIAAIGSVLISTIVAGVGVGRKNEVGVPIRYSGETVVVGKGELRNILIQPVEKILGRHFSYAIRSSINGEGAWAVYEFVPESIPPSASRLILSGGDLQLPSHLGDLKGGIFWVNPEKLPQKQTGHQGANRIILGGLRKDVVAKTLAAPSFSKQTEWNISIIPGKKTYIGNWLDAVFPTPNSSP